MTPTGEKTLAIGILSQKRAKKALNGSVKEWDEGRMLVSETRKRERERERNIHLKAKKVEQHKPSLPGLRGKYFIQNRYV